MFILIPSLIAVASIWAVARIVNRRIPNESKEVEAWQAEVANSSFGSTFYEKFLAVAEKKTKEVALNVSTKMLYRLKIGTLKTDNFFAKMIQKTKHHRQNAQALTEAKENQDAYDRSVTPVMATQESKVEDVIESEIISVKPAKEEMDFHKSEETSPKDSFEFLEQQFINQLAYNPRDVSIYKKLGWLYLENDHHIQARQSFKTALKLGSKDKMVMAKLLEMGGTIHKDGPAPKVELSRQTFHNAVGVAEASPAIYKKPASAGKLVKIRKIRLTKTRV